MLPTKLENREQGVTTKLESVSVRPLLAQQEELPKTSSMKLATLVSLLTIHCGTGLSIIPPKKTAGNNDIKQNHGPLDWIGDAVAAMTGVVSGSAWTGRRKIDSSKDDTIYDKVDDEVDVVVCAMLADMVRRPSSIWEALDQEMTRDARYRVKKRLQMKKHSVNSKKRLLIEEQIAHLRDLDDQEEMQSYNIDLHIQGNHYEIRQNLIFDLKMKTVDARGKEKKLLKTQIRYLKELDEPKPVTVSVPLSAMLAGPISLNVTVPIVK